MYQPWMGGARKKRKMEEPPVVMEDEEEEGPSIPFVFPKPPSTNICAMHNRIYFNDDVTYDSMFSLNKEMRNLDDKLMAFALIHRCDPLPIYLHITTYGGIIHAAFSAVDCMKSLRCPVYTVVDGFVASAGTLLTLAGKKRYIQPNAYMLFHELRSGFWGKMSDINQEYCNLKKVMEHLTTFYTENTPLTAKQLEKLLIKDSIWSSQECLDKGVVDELFS